MSASPASPEERPDEPALPEGIDPAEVPDSADWRVRLDHFAGPLDLLLHLVRKNEVDIHDIPIATILEQYMLHIEAIKELDLDAAGEFLVMATTLMVIKSKLLLPSEEVDLEDEIDPRYELVQQLLEYKKARDGTDLLQQRAATFGQMLGRPESARPEPEEVGERPLEEISIFELLSAYVKLKEALGPTHGQNVRRVRGKEVPVRVFVGRLRERLKSSGSLLFSELVGASDRQELVGNFLALLLLLKLEACSAAQAGPRGDIRIVWRDTPSFDSELARAHDFD